MGADGMKTGHTDDGGYGIVASAKQGDRRLILVVNGLPTSKDRDLKQLRLLNWGFNFFKNYKILEKGDVVDIADVWSGNRKIYSPCSSKDNIFTLLAT